jgi:hypothetical protein
MLLAAAANSYADGESKVRSIIVWDGEQAVKGSGWAHKEVVTLERQAVVAHSGTIALEMRCNGTKSIWAGWNWTAFTKGEGTDVRQMQRLVLWVKHAGKAADLQINLLCGPKTSGPGEEFDTPEHHTEKVALIKYCPNLMDGEWHRIAIPLADFITVPGYDPTKVAELQMGFFGESAVECSFFIDDIGFEAGGSNDAPAWKAPGGPDTIVFQNGFEDSVPGTGDWQKIWGSPWGTPSHPDGANASPEAVEGDRSMRVIYPKGGVGPGQTGIQWPTITADTYEELYLRYYVYFEDGFDFKIGGKLPGMMSAGHAKLGSYIPDGTNAWLMRFMWREGAKAEVYALLPPSRFTGFAWSFDVKIDFAFSTGKWFCIEQYIKLNSLGSEDGKLKVWIDGVNLLDRSDVLYRSVDSEGVKIGGFYFSTFHGGDTLAWAPSVDSYARFDAIVLSKESVGLIPAEPKQ